MTPRYYATVQYQEGREVNNTEFNTLVHIAASHEGSYKASSQKGGFVAFEFSDQENAERFKRQSQQLSEYIAGIKIAESQ